MAYKDEYEVARLLTKPSFEAGIRDAWTQVESISYNLHPPLLRKFGFRKKLAIGPWFRRPLKMLAAMKGVRGGPLDIFGRSKHRRMERDLIVWYRDLVSQLMEHNPPNALEIAALPDQIRGYELIKESSIAQTKKRAAEMLQESQRESTLVS
jgi:indolepyruvate ferredoxin oxidoreductase